MFRLFQTTLQDGSSSLDIGIEHRKLAEVDISAKPTVSPDCPVQVPNCPDSDPDPQQMEVGYAFSKRHGSNFTLTQSADKIMYASNRLQSLNIYSFISVDGNTCTVTYFFSIHQFYAESYLRGCKYHHQRRSSRDPL